MALTCSTSIIQYQDFEFIDCSTISVNYAVKGFATINFTVVSTRQTLLNSYADLVFGGVTFKTFTTGVEINPIPGTLVFEIRLSLLGFGC